MALKKDPLLKRISDFFAYNWWLTGVSNVVLIILMVILISKQNEIQLDFQARLNKAMSNIIYGTPDGRVGLLDKKLVNTDSDVFKNHIAQITKKMAASESLLTQGFNSSVSASIKTPASLLETVEDYKILNDNFFANVNVGQTFFRFYYNSLRQGQLPKKATILSSKYSYYPVGENGFKIHVTLKTAKDFVDKTNNRVSELIVDDVYKIEGVVDPSSHSSSLNPFGIRITDVKLDLFLYQNFITGQTVR